MAVNLEKQSASGSDNTYEVDGIKYCSKCNMPRNTRLRFLDREYIMPVMCICEAKAYDAEGERMENMEKQFRLNKLRQFSMMDRKFGQCTFDNWHHESGTENLYKLGVNYVKNWPDMKRKNIGFMFWGKPGTGKSYLSFCIANALLDQYVPVIAISTIGLLNRIKQTYSNYGKEGEAEIINSLQNASLLVLDDLGAENSSSWAKEKLYEIIDSRYRTGKPMITTTNLTPEQLKIKLQGDDGVDRTYDRLIEMCIPVEVQGMSKRREAAAWKQNIIEQLIAE